MLDRNQILFQAKGTHTFLCLAVLIALCSLLFLLNASSLPLADPEESRCALTVQDIFRTGDWIVPHLQNRLYFDKPMPFFWLAAAGQYFSGSLEAGGRLVAAVSGLLAVLVAFAFASRLKDNFTGLLAGIILATSPEFFFLARWYRMESLFTLLMWAALWWFWRYEAQSDTKKLKRTFKWLGFYVFCALATLVKGPAGLVLPLAVVAGYLTIRRGLTGIKEIFSLPGIIAYLLIAAIWYVPIAIRSPEWIYQFFVVQNFHRYTGQGFGHRGLSGWGPLTYIPFLLGGLLPWTIYLPMTIEKNFPRKWSANTQSPNALFLWLAAIVPFIFFSFSGVKLSSYILPVFPPMAVLIAWALAEWVDLPDRDKNYLHGTTLLPIALVAILSTLAVVEIYMHWLDLWIALPVLSMAASLVMMHIEIQHRRRKSFLCWAIIAVVTTLLFAILHTAPYLFDAMSYHKLVLPIRSRITPETVLCYWDCSPYSFPLYLGRTSAIHIDDEDPNQIKELIKLLSSEQPVYVCCPKDEFEDFNKFRTAYQGPMSIPINNGEFLIFTNVTEKN